MKKPIKDDESDEATKKTAKRAKELTALKKRRRVVDELDGPIRRHVTHKTNVIT